MSREIRFVVAWMTLAYVPIVGSRVVYSLLALDIGADALDVGLIIAGMQFPMLLLSIPVAAALERWGSRPLLIAGGVLGVAGFLLPWLWPSLPVLYAGALLFGLWNVLAFQPTQKLVAELSGIDRRARNMSVYAFFAASSLLVGPLIGGVAVDWLGAAAAGLALLPFAAACVLMPVLGAALLRRQAPRGEPAPALAESLRDPEVRRLIVVTSMISASMELFPFFMPLYGHAAGLSASVIGSIVSASALGQLALPLVLTRLARRIGEAGVLSIGMMLIGVAFAIVPFSTNPWVLSAASFLYGFACAAGNPLSVLLAYARLSEARANQFLGLRNSANAGMRSAGPPVFGALAAAIGLLPVYLLSAALMVAGGALARRMLR